jgi:hypothetical protein
MSIEEYSIINDPEAECHVCGDNENLVYDEDGDVICTDCLFKQKTEETLKGTIWDPINITYLRRDEKQSSSIYILFYNVYAVTEKCIKCGHTKIWEDKRLTT